MADSRPDVERTRRVSAHPRHALRCPVRVSGIDPEIDQETRLPCFVSIEESSVNLSEGGVFVPGEDTLTPGCRVMVEIDLPSGATFQALGAVVWRRRPLAARAGDRPAGMGIAFTGMSRASTMALADALETRRKPRGAQSRRGRTRYVHSA